MILVTGGTGLLGSHLLFDLVSKGFTVKATCRSDSSMTEIQKVFSLYSDNPTFLFNKIEWVEADILNYQDVLAVMEGVEKVYHCAALVSFDPSDRQRMIRNNMDGTANMVNAAIEHNVKKFLHVSSVAAIGTPPDENMADETCIWTEARSNSAYSISKFRSEMEVWRGIEEGLDAVIVNPSIILGPGFWDRGSSLIFTRVDHGLRFFTRGITGYVGIWDVVRAMEMLMHSGYSGERFIINSENLSYREVFTKVANALGRREPGIEATRILAGLAWRMDWLISKLLRLKKIVLTREQLRLSRNVIRFDNRKICAALNFEFEPVALVVGKIAGYYKQDKR